MQRVVRFVLSMRLFSKPLTKIAMALCVGLFFPLMAIYTLGEIRKENELRKELDALSYQHISPYKETVEELFRNIDQKTLAFSNTAALDRLTKTAETRQIEEALRAAHREVSELLAANCCDSSIELYYRQTGLITLQTTGQSIPVNMDDAVWKAYKNMLSDKVHWFADEEMMKITGSPVISLIRPIPSVGDQPQGLIKVNFNSSLFEFGYRQPEGQSIWAVTPDGRWMFDMAGGKATSDSRIVHRLEEEAISSAFIKVNGVTYGYRLFSSPTSGWSFLLRLPPGAFSTANPVKWLIYAASLLLMFAAFLYILRHFSRIARRVDVLVHKEELIEGKLKELLPTLRQHGLQKLLFTALPSEEECRKKLLECGMSVSSGGYIVVILRMEEYERFLQYSYRDQSLFRFFITKASEEIAERDGYVLYAYDSGQRDVALLLLLEQPDAASQPDSVKQLVEQLSSVLRQYLPFRISAAVGSPCETAIGIHVSCQNAMHTLGTQLYKGNSGVFAYEEHPADSIHSPELYRMRKETEQIIGKALLSRDPAQLGGALEELRKELERLPGQSLAIVRHTFWELIMFIYHRMQEAGLKPSEELRLSELHARLEKLVSLPAIIDWCRELSGRLIEEHQNGLGAGKVNVVTKIMDYVHANFDKEISLGGIADQMGLDMAYVSRCFKQEVGMTFMDYLLTLRLKHAKYLLGKPDLTVSEIGEAVGYVNVNSFIRIFKKHEGVTPGQYRELNHPRELDISQVY